MTIQKIIELLQTHHEQNRELEIEICINGGGVYYQPVDIEFTLDGDVYLTTNELGNHEAVRVLPQYNPIETPEAHLKRINNEL